MNGRTLDADDLARGVAHLDDETILRMLHDRYDEKAIYSSVNRMLIAINPYEDLGLYSAAMLETYAALGGESRRRTRTRLRRRPSRACSPAARNPL